MVDGRSINVSDMDVPTGVAVVGRICCASNKYSDEPTWEKKNEFVVNLKIRMSKDSKIAMYNGYTKRIEEFSCEKPGCIDDRLIMIYQVSGLSNKVGKIQVKYYCEGDFFQSNIDDGKDNKFVGIHVIKGQVRIDDTSDDRIWCMPKKPGDNIWTADEFYRSNSEGKNRSTQRAKAPDERTSLEKVKSR